MEKCLTIEDGVERVLKIFEKEPASWELIPAGEGDYTDTLALLMETANPAQGRLRGKTNEELVIEGKDKFFVQAAENGRLYVPFDENGHPLATRVARHVTGVAQIAISYTELGLGNLKINGIPSYYEMVEDMGVFLDPTN